MAKQLKMYRGSDSVSNASSSNASSTFVRGEYTEPLDLEMGEEAGFRNPLGEPSNINVQSRNHSFTNNNHSFTNNNFENINQIDDMEEEHVNEVPDSQTPNVSKILVDSIIKQEVIFKLLTEMNFDECVIEKVKIMTQDELNALYPTLSAIYRKVTVGYKHLIVAICEVFDEIANTFMNISVNSTDVARQMMQNSIEKQTLLAKMDVVRMTASEISQINNNQAANEDLIFTIQFLLNVVKSTLLANKS